jgi:hypothetical protein
MNVAARGEFASWLACATKMAYLPLGTPDVSVERLGGSILEAGTRNSCLTAVAVLFCGLQLQSFVPAIIVVNHPAVSQELTKLHEWIWPFINVNPLLCSRG